MQLKIVVSDSGAMENLSAREIGYLKRGGWINGGEGGIYHIADSVPNGWLGICSILQKRKDCLDS